jgi:hypothetical protein
MALPPGMFSVAGITPTTLSGRRISAIAFMAPSTLAAPHMSNFISSISAAGLIEMPPVSNVMPLPTSAPARVALAAVVLHDDQLRRLAAAARHREEAAHAELLELLLLEHSTFTPFLLPISTACSRGRSGVQWLPGRLPRSLAKAMPLGDRLATRGGRFAGGDLVAAAPRAARPCAASAWLPAPCSSVGRIGMQPSMTASTACSTFHPVSRLFTGTSVRQIVASEGRWTEAPSPPRTWRPGTRPRRIPRSRPKATERMRSAGTPGYAVEQQRLAKRALEVALAQDLGHVAFRGGIDGLAGAESLRPSNTPTTTQPARCFSGLPLFMLNSICFPRLGVRDGRNYRTRAHANGPSHLMIFQRSLIREFSLIAIAVVGPAASSCSRAC